MYTLKRSTQKTFLLAITPKSATFKYFPISAKLELERKTTCQKQVPKQTLALFLFWRPQTTAKNLETHSHSHLCVCLFALVTLFGAQHRLSRIVRENSTLDSCTFNRSSCCLPLGDFFFCLFLSRKSRQMAAGQRDTGVIVSVVWRNCSGTCKQNARSVAGRVVLAGSGAVSQIGLSLMNEVRRGTRCVRCVGILKQRERNLKRDSLKSSVASGMFRKSGLLAGISGVLKVRTVIWWMTDRILSTELTDQSKHLMVDSIGWNYTVKKVKFGRFKIWTSFLCNFTTIYVEERFTREKM